MATRLENEKYLAFVRTLPCCHCESPYTVPHHIIGIGMGIMGSKAADVHTMPLCDEDHREVHKDPDSWPQIKWMIETQVKAIRAGVLTSTPKRR